MSAGEYLRRGLVLSDIVRPVKARSVAVAKKRGDKIESAEAKLARLYFTTAESRELLGCSYETLWRYRRNGLIDGTTEVLKYGRSLYWKKSAIQRLANSLIPG